MAFHAAFDPRSRLSLEMDVGHDDGRSDEVSIVDMGAYDLENSNSGFGIAFSMDDAWTKTPLMEELDAFTSAASPLVDDDQPITITQSQWRVQGSKITKVSPAAAATTSDFSKSKKDDGILMKDVIRDNWFSVDSVKPTGVPEVLPLQVLEDEPYSNHEGSVPLSPLTKKPQVLTLDLSPDLKVLPEPPLVALPVSPKTPVIPQTCAVPFPSAKDFPILPLQSSSAPKTQQPAQPPPQTSSHTLLKAKLSSEPLMPEALSCLMPSLTQVLYNCKQGNGCKMLAYSCRLCHKKFVSLIKLHAHQRMKHHVCKVCHECFELASLLDEHQRKIHFKCIICKEAFDSDRQLHNHEMKHVLDQQCKVKKELCPECECDISGCLDSHECYVMHCSLCDKAFRNLYKLALHRTTQHPTCSECNVSFKNFDSMLLHEEVQHFSCAVCSVKCLDNEALSMHKRVDHCKCKWCKNWFRDRKMLATHEEQAPFPCVECDAEFCSLSQLSLHEREMHQMCSVCKVVCSNPKEVELHTHHACPLCSLEFLSSGALLDHQMREHSSCPLCLAVFRNPEMLARHCAMQHSNHFPCSVCGNILESTELLVAHLKTHIPCRACASFFLDEEALAKHIRDEHGKATSVSDQSLVVCTYCDQRFAAHDELRAHQVFMHATCKQCGLVWVNKKALSAHVRKTHKKQRDKWPKVESSKPKLAKVRCSLCRKSFASMEKLTSHQQSHHAVCTICNTMWPNKKSLKSHINMTHTPPDYDTDDDKRVRSGSQGESDGSDWVCQTCGKSFASSKSLQSHMRKCRDGKGSQNYNCSFCDLKFTCRTSYTEHNRECSKGKRVPCPVCRKTFSTSGNLAQHKRIHTSERPYTCDVCGKSFAQNGTLYRHKTVHTGETPFVCPRCGKQFGLKGNLMMHIRNIHKSYDYTELLPP